MTFPSTRPCGCPLGGAVPAEREAEHRAFHALVEEQTGIAWGQPLHGESLQAARGMKTSAPDGHVIAERNERQGKSSPGWRRRASR
jgi:hypothetical protein